MQIQKEWVLLEEVVGSALARLEDSLGVRPLELKLADGWIQLDPVLFEQVLVNLVENALKYSPEGTPICIEGRIEEGRVILELSDRGPGFPKGEESRIFEKLYRGTTSKGTPGAGLGLAICKGIVEAHGGCIEARNLNPGGQIRIVLPLEGQPPQEEA
jgi:two-component system sensor histidine kinase KdpD